MILDCYGSPVPITHQRRALGFVETMLLCEEQETVTGTAATGRMPDWIEDESSANPICEGAARGPRATAQSGG